jgi:hypothetical protein
MKEKKIELDNCRIEAIKSQMMINVLKESPKYKEFIEFCENNGLYSSLLPPEKILESKMKRDNLTEQEKIELKNKQSELKRLREELSKEAVDISKKDFDDIFQKHM